MTPEEIVERALGLVDLAPSRVGARLNDVLLLVVELARVVGEL